MTATDRLRSEQVFHNQQAQARRQYFAQHPEVLRVDEDGYLDHESWIRPAFALLGDVRGRRVLDYGCGHGMASVLLAKRGAAVTAFDLSAGYLEEAALRASVNGVRGQVQFVQAAAEALPFQDASFDGVWGNAVLHHLDLPQAAPELARVLKPGGIAVFCEPWGENPLLAWARRRLPYPGKQRSPDEQPLRRRDLTIFRRHFADMQVQPFQLLGMIRRLRRETGSSGGLRSTLKVSGGLRPPLAFLDRWDTALLRRWPGLRQFCRYIVLYLRR